MSVISFLKQKTQRRKLLVVQLSFVIIMFTLMAAVITYFVNDTLSKNLYRESNEILKQVSLEINAEFSEPQTALIAISENIRDMIINGSGADEVYKTMEKLAGELESKPDGFTFVSIFGYFETFGGLYMSSPEWDIPEDYVPTERPWYEAAIKAGGSISYTPIYWNMRANDYMITFVRRIFDDNGEPLAIMCLNMPLDRIRNYVAGMYITEGSYGIFHDDRMNIFYHPDPHLIGRNSKEVGGGIARLIDEIVDKGTLVDREARNYKDELCVFSSTQLENGWVIYMVTPKAQYYSALRRMVLIVVVLGIVCASTLCFILINVDRAIKKAEEKDHLNNLRLIEIEKTREEDERTRLMLDTTPLGISFRDSKHNTIYCSEETVKMFGLSCRQDFVDRFYELSPEYQPSGRRSKELELELHNKVLEEGYIRFEWVHQKLDGEQIPCEIIGVRVDYRDEPCVLSYIKDLREIKTAIAEKEEADERINLIINAMPFVCNLWVKDHTNNFKNIMTNDEAVKLFDVSSKEEYIDRFFDLMPEFQPDGKLSGETAMEHIRKAYDEGSYSLEWMHQKLNGEPMPSEITLIRIKYKRDYAVAGFIRDLREYKQMMNTIKRRETLLNTINQEAITLLSSESEENFNSIILTSMELLGATVDVDHVQIWQVETKDGELHARHGFQWESGFGRQSGSIPIGTAIPLESLPNWKNESSFDVVINGPIRELPKKDQEAFTPFNIKSFLTVPLVLNERLWGFFTLDDCRNERTFSEEEINILRSGGLLIANAIIHKDMMQNIRSGAKQLEAALREAQEANNAKSKFLANISHEIRTPMNVIIGSTESLLENESQPKESRETLERIHNSGDLLLQIINDILDLSKIEANKFEINNKKYEITSLINDAANLNMAKYGQKNIIFKLQVDENLPLILVGDMLRVKQIINNLLSNAFKYTDTGEVLLSFAGENTTDETTIMIIRVTDTGHGMTSEQVSRLFDEYTRFNLEANRTTIGTGLGMAITRNLVKLMKGEIEVESTPGKGSVFTVRIPQGVADSRLLGREASNNFQNFRFGDNARKKKAKIIRTPMPYGKVLVVDDMKSNIDVAMLLLKPYQLQIDTAGSGYEAIDKIKSGKKYDLVFMDHMMPNMDGIETVKLIREWEREQVASCQLPVASEDRSLQTTTLETGNRKPETNIPYTPIPIIALTANALVGHAQMFMENGFDGYISKPIDLRELNALLNEFIRNKKAP